MPSLQEDPKEEEEELDKDNKEEEDKDEQHNGTIASDGGACNDEVRALIEPFTKCERLSSLSKISRVGSCGR